MGLPLLRGTTDYADCASCPFSRDGRPNNPVLAEFPADPAFLLVGEWPGRNEVIFRRPMVGETGQTVVKVLSSVGKTRDQVLITNATLCLSYNTRVRLADGSNKTIADIVRTRYAGEVATVGLDGQLTTRRIVGWHKNPRNNRQLYRLTTDYGNRAGPYTVNTRLTGDHLVLSAKGWLPAQELNGVKIATADVAWEGAARSIVLAGLLGDGWASRSTFGVSHAKSCEDYLLAKATAFNFDGRLYERPAEGERQAHCRFDTPASGWYRQLRQEFYPEGERIAPAWVWGQLDRMALAIWFLDDGNTRREEGCQPSSSISAVSKTDEARAAAVKAFHDFGVPAYTRAGRIFFNVDATPLLSRFVAPYTPPSMAYKLLPDDRGKFDLDLYRTSKKIPFFDRAFVEKTEPSKLDSFVYCIDVEETHNFLTSNAVVHNCLPTSDNPNVRDQAARACNARLKMELRQFPGKPILTMGNTAARAIIPQASFDAIDSPETRPSHKKKQKERQRAIDKAAAAKEKKREAIAEKLIKKFLKQWHPKAKRDVVAKFEPAVLTAIETRAYREADEELERKELAQVAKRAAAPKKRKLIGISAIAGTTFLEDIDGTGKRLIIPTINLAAIQRGGGKALLGAHTPDLAIWNVIADVAKINAHAAGKNIFLEFPGEIEFVDRDRAAKLFYKFYKLAVAEGAFALDTETYVEDSERHNALQAYKAKIRVIGLATLNWSIAVVWDLLPPWCLALLKALLLSQKVRIIAHNRLYDETVMRANGLIWAGPIDCSMLRHHSAFPGGAHNLQSVTAQFYGVSPWKSEFRNNEETPEKLVRYCQKDTYSARKIDVALTVWIKRSQTERVYESDKRMAACASRMHLDGVPVSREENSVLLKQFLLARDEAREKLHEAVHDREVMDRIWDNLAMEQAKKQRLKDSESFRERQTKRLDEIKADHAKGKWAWKISANQHIAALLRALDVQLTAITEKGATKVNKEILEGLVEVPIVRDILRFRENDKLISTFVWPLFDRTLKDGTPFYGFADEADRVHPIWSIHKITGRWASGDPIVSNIPKAKYKKLADGSKQILRPNIRRQYVAPQGRVFVGFDFCLAQGTLIDTPNGHRAIETLKPGDLVFSFNNETQRPSCRPVTNVVPTGQRKTLKVILDNGEEVRCTPDHRWLRYDGSEVRADALRPKDRLLALRRGVAGSKKIGNDYETLYARSAFEYTKTHVAVTEAVHGPRPEGFHIHHKNGDRRDNAPSNLEYLTPVLHAQEHSEATVRQWQDPATRAAMAGGIAASIKKRGGYHGSNNPNYGTRRGTFGKCAQCGAETYKGGKKPQGKFCNRACYVAFRHNNPRKRGEKYVDRNHKVVAIIADDLIVPTWDIEVDRDHNFALAAGVFVHNCQLEAKILALLSGDPWLCHVFTHTDAFGKPLDIHREAARIIWPEFDALEEYQQKQLRERAKPFEYGAFYGADPETLYKQLLKEGMNVTRADVYKAHATLMAKLSGVVRYQANAFAMASQPPFTLTSLLLGRKRIFPMGQVDASECKNWPCQSEAADIMNTGMSRMMDTLLSYHNAFPILQIHDAAVFECWEDDAEELLADVVDRFTQECTNPLNGVTIKFDVDAKIAKSWAEL